MKLLNKSMAVAVLLSAFFFAAYARAQEPLKVRFGILTTGSQTPFYVGVKKGISPSTASMLKS